MNVGIIIVTGLVSLVTFFTGFGLGTLLMPCMALFFPITSAIALTAVVHFCNNLFKVAFLWRHVQWRITFLFGVPALLAAAFGARLLVVFSSSKPLFTYFVLSHQAVVTPLKLGVGFLLLFFVSVHWEHFGSLLGKRPALVYGGLLSGFFGGFSGHQGAIRNAFLVHTNLDSVSFVATGAMISLLVDMVRLTVYSEQGNFLQDVSLFSILSVVGATFTGVLFGRIVLPKVTIRVIRSMVAGMIVLIALLLIIGVI